MRKRSLFERALALGAALTTLAHTGLARAEGTGLSLEWETLPGCPSREVVLQRVRGIVGPSLDEAERVRAQGRIERQNGRYRLILKMQVAAADSEREIEAVSCSDLAGAAAVALALLVRDEAASRSSASSAVAPGGSKNAAQSTTPSSSSERGTEERDAAKAATEASQTSASPPSSASDARTWRFLLRAPLVGLDVGPLPHPSPTIGVAAGVRFDAFELTLGARLGLTQTIWVEDTPDYGAELRRIATELRACYAFRSAPLAVAPCALFALDPITASGVGAEVSAQTSTTVVPAVGVAAMGSVQLAARWALIASAGLQLQTSRPHIIVDGLGEVTQLSAFAFSTSLGIELNL